MVIYSVFCRHLVWCHLVVGRGSSRRRPTNRDPGGRKLECDVEFTASIDQAVVMLVEGLESRVFCQKCVDLGDCNQFRISGMNIVSRLQERVGSESHLSLLHVT